MSVRYGGGPADYAVAPTGGIIWKGVFIPGGQIVPNAEFTAYADEALTVQRTDLTTETGAASGSTVFGRASGYYVFFRPDGSTGPVYVSDGAGGSVAIYPAGGGGGGGGSNVSTGTRADGAPTLVVS